MSSRPANRFKQVGERITVWILYNISARGNYQLKHLVIRVGCKIQQVQKRIFVCYEFRVAHARHHVRHESKVPRPPCELRDKVGGVASLH